MFWLKMFSEEQRARGSKGFACCLFPSPGCCVNIVFGFPFRFDSISGRLGSVSLTSTFRFSLILSLAASAMRLESRWHKVGRSSHVIRLSHPRFQICSGLICLWTFIYFTRFVFLPFSLTLSLINLPVAGPIGRSGSARRGDVVPVVYVQRLRENGFRLDLGGQLRALRLKVVPVA